MKKRKAAGAEKVASNSEEIATGLSILRALLTNFAQLATRDDPAETMRTIKRVTGAFSGHGRPRGRRRPPRGLGYELNDALIVASLPDHGNSLTKAVRAHFPDYDEDRIQVAVKRIRRHTAEIEAAQPPEHAIFEKSRKDI